MSSNALPMVMSISTEPSVTDPPGSSRPASSRAAVMSPWEAPAAAIAASSMVRRTISPAAPINWTVATPGTDSRSGMVDSSTLRASSDVSESEETATIMAGRSLVPPVMTCVPVPSGSWASTRFRITSACDAAR